MRYILLLLLIITPCKSFAGRDFAFAKKQAEYIYSMRQTSFYCGCDYARTTEGLEVNYARCAYNPKSESPRSHKIEWDHVVPASRFGGNLQCWKEGGRKACESDPLFQEMESDLYNLVPSIGEINNAKSDKPMMEIEEGQKEYGGCDIVITKEGVEPANNIKGDIARIYLYMQWRYNIELTDQEKDMFIKWSFDDPVSKKEMDVANMIVLLQGNRNYMLTQ